MLYAASYHIYGHMHLLESTDTDRMGLWVYSIGGQALALYTPIQSINAIYTQSGLGTEEVLWEIAAASIASTVCGLHQGGVGATGGSTEDHTSGLENRFNAQVAHSSLGMTRSEANGYVTEIIARYEESHKNPLAGKPFAELYNVDTLEPTEEWLDIYNRVSAALVNMGLDIQNGWKKALHPQ
jgi:methylamine--corrinoid protein Co-methyltransferase